MQTKGTNKGKKFFDEVVGSSGMVWWLLQVSLSPAEYYMGCVLDIERESMLCCRVGGLIRIGCRVVLEENLCF